MLFGGKKNGKGRVPVEEARKLSQQGLSDKEIIDRLRKEGYSFEEIQKAMLELVKGSVEQPAPQLDIPKPEPAGLELPGTEGGGEVFEEMPEDIEVAGEMENPEDIVEELVEGIVEEKIKSFDDKLSRLEEKLAGIKSDIEEVRGIKKANLDISEFSMKMEELETKVMDLNVRVGALEKAFKQMLPSLVENIHSLSRIVHELKNSHEEVRERVFSFGRHQEVRQGHGAGQPAVHHSPQPPGQAETEEGQGNVPAQERVAAGGGGSGGLSEEEIRRILGKM